MMVQLNGSSSLRPCGRGTMLCPGLEFPHRFVQSFEAQDRSACAI